MEQQAMGAAGWERRMGRKMRGCRCCTRRRGGEAEPRVGLDEREKSGGVGGRSMRPRFMRVLMMDRGRMAWPLRWCGVLGQGRECQGAKCSGRRGKEKGPVVA